MQLHERMQRSNCSCRAWANRNFLVGSTLSDTSPGCFRLSAEHLFSGRVSLQDLKLDGSFFFLAVVNPLDLCTIRSCMDISNPFVFRKQDEQEWPCCGAEGDWSVNKENSK